MLFKYTTSIQFGQDFTNALNSDEFNQFTRNQPALAKYVIEHAYSVIQQYGYIWDNIVSFAKNYAGVIDHYTHDNLDIQAKWAMHARLVRSFSIGA